MKNALTYLNPSLGVTEKNDSFVFTFTPSHKLTLDEVKNFFRLDAIERQSTMECTIFQRYNNVPLELSVVEWRAMVAPKYSVYVPFYPMLINETPESYRILANEDNVETYNPKSAYFAFQGVKEKCYADPAGFGKNVISKYSAEEVYNASYKWAESFDAELKEMLDNKEYALKVLGIERGNAKPRKDIAKWSDVKDIIYYMYDDKFDKTSDFEYQKINDKEEVEKIVKTYFEKYYNEVDDKETWFNKMKDLAEEFGYAREVKEFKANPENYKGHVGDISTVIRVKITGRCNTPDLYEILQIIGKERLLKRI